MASDISPDNELFIEHSLQAGHFGTRGELLDAAVSLLREEEETLAAVRDALASIDRGEGMDVAEADARLREKHGFQSLP